MSAVLNYLSTLTSRDHREQKFVNFA